MGQGGGGGVTLGVVLKQARRGGAEGEGLPSATFAAYVKILKYYYK